MVLQSQVVFEVAKAFNVYKQNTFFVLKIPGIYEDYAEWNDTCSMQLQDIA